MTEPLTTALLPGQPSPLGATLMPGGVNFAVFSESATGIDLCVFDPIDGRELSRQALPVRSIDVWHGFLPGAGAGLVYGLRAHGPDDPSAGHRFAPGHLLLDPYARALTGRYIAGPALPPAARADRDNAPERLRAVVVDDDDFDWQGDSPPATDLADTILYEVHVKGFSQRHPAIGADQRGTYRALGSPAAIAHFQALGVTALNLLPVHHSVSEPHLVQRGRTNYWGYNTLAYFAPDARFARTDARREFREMVRSLHRAGLEVILDVVYNHTAEGDATGPTLSWRGLDNQAYYRLRREDARHYENFTGCGNTLNLAHPRVLQMVLDSLRYWVTHMHVDGFRFDLAVTLGRGPEGFDTRSSFLQAIAQDPVLGRVKLIAEPWDIGPGGYRLGGFPGQWSEWNDRYRQAARSFWLSKPADRGDFPERLIGSPDVFGWSRRGHLASINYICSHDGFTLQDLLSYDHKHNLANGEANRDGSDQNLSWNCGEEGPSKLLAVNAMRRRLKRALLATLLLSRGVPMLLGGDELSRTQDGNNNAYQQDDRVGWFDWSGGGDDWTGYIAALVALRRRLAPMHRPRWSVGAADVVWLSRHGQISASPRWPEQDRFVFGLRLAGPPDVLWLFNAEARDWPFPMPSGRWRVCLDTARDPAIGPAVESLITAGDVLLGQRSLMLLEQETAS